MGDTVIADPTNRAEAEARIDVLVKEAHAAIKSAERLADKWCVPFGFDVAYGMGGSYTPRHKKDSVWSKPADGDDFVTVDGEEVEYYVDEYADDGWVSSSSQC